MYAKRRIFVCQAATSGANFREIVKAEVQLLRIYLYVKFLNKGKGNVVNDQMV